VAIDALIVINFLNNSLNFAGEGEGEGEAVPSPSLPATVAPVAAASPVVADAPANDGSQLAAIGDLGVGTSPSLPKPAEDLPAAVGLSAPHVVATDWVFTATAANSDDSTDNQAADEDDAPLADLLAPLVE
jgi:hypothetical protein